MLFSKEELLEFQNEHNGQNSITTRKEFVQWLEDLKEALREQISQDDLLPKEHKLQRIKRAGDDFEYFAKTYFPHFFTIDGTPALHSYLFSTFEKIAKIGRASCRERVLRLV